MSAHVESFLPLTHENLHYLQSITTFTGIYRFLCFWEAYTKISSAVLTDLESKYSKETRQIAWKAFEKANQSRLNLDPHYNSFDIEQKIPTGPQVLDLPDGERVYGFVRQLNTGDFRVFPFTQAALSESMASSYEIWMGREISYFQPFRDSVDPNVFQYVLGMEATKEISEVSNPRLQTQLTFILADQALNHIAPGMAFIQGHHVIDPNLNEPLSENKVDEICRALSSVLLIEEMVEEVDRLSDHLDMIIDAVTKDSDPFDVAVRSFAHLMKQSLQIRKDDPGYFCKQLLFHFNEPDFLKNYHMPLYRHGSDFIDTGLDPDRYNAVLFFEVLYHRLQTLVDTDVSKQCPFFESRICGFVRQRVCKEAPWERDFIEAEKQNVCLYKFVEHGLEISNNSGKISCD